MATHSLNTLFALQLRQMQQQAMQQRQDALMAKQQQEESFQRGLDAVQQALGMYNQAAELKHKRDLETTEAESFLGASQDAAYQPQEFANPQLAKAAKLGLMRGSAAYKQQQERAGQQEFENKLKGDELGIKQEKSAREEELLPFQIAESEARAGMYGRSPRAGGSSGGSIAGQFSRAVNAAAGPVKTQMDALRALMVDLQTNSPSWKQDPKANAKMQRLWQAYVPLARQYNAIARKYAAYFDMPEIDYEPIDPSLFLGDVVASEPPPPPPPGVQAPGAGATPGVSGRPDVSKAAEIMGLTK